MSAFRQQAKRVTERLNQTIENYMRAFTNANSDVWTDYLGLCEFVYNARYRAAIGMPPFVADNVYVPRTPATHTPSLGGGEVQRDPGPHYITQQQNLLAKARQAMKDTHDWIEERTTAIAQSKSLRSTTESCSRPRTWRSSMLGRQSGSLVPDGSDHTLSSSA